jgi:2-aminoadipate transaminase
MGGARRPTEAVRDPSDGEVRAEPGVISFASGSPNPALFPYDTIARVTAEIMADPARRGPALQYGGSEGYLPLRELIVDHLGRTGARVAVENVVITNGSQQALEFVAKLLIDPGDRIVVTNPTYLGAFQAFNLFEPVYAGVPIDQSGVDLAALEQEFRRGAKLMYLMPDFGNPSGVTLPLEQRTAILDLSRRYGVPILEDQAYEQLRFTDERLPSMLALDAERGADGTVIYAGTFSKTLVPGLRVGWLVAPRPVAEKLVFVKQASDLQTGSLNQMIVHGVAQAIFDQHVPVLRESYRRSRDAVLRALRRHMPQSVTWNEPEGACSSGSRCRPRSMRRRSRPAPSPKRWSSSPAPRSSPTVRARKPCGCRSPALPRTRSVKASNACRARSAPVWTTAGSNKTGPAGCKKQKASL